MQVCSAAWAAAADAGRAAIKAANALEQQPEMESDRLVVKKEKDEIIEQIKRQLFQ